MTKLNGVVQVLRSILTTTYDALRREEMHFSKTYTQLLITLPPELRNNAFEYRKVRPDTESP